LNKISGAPLKHQTDKCIIGIDEGEDIQAKGIENLFNEIIAEISPNLGKVMDIKVQDVFTSTNRYDGKQRQTYTTQCS
jgi:hypothetical protein